MCCVADTYCVCVCVCGCLDSLTAAGGVVARVQLAACFSVAAA